MPLQTLKLSCAQPRLETKGQKSSLTPPLDIEEWGRLRKADTVAIQRLGEFPVTGLIDDIAGNANVFWVNLDQGRGRILVHAGDQVEVRLVL